MCVCVRTGGGGCYRGATEDLQELYSSFAQAPQELYRSSPGALYRIFNLRYELNKRQIIPGENPNREGFGIPFVSFRSVRLVRFGSVRFVFVSFHLGSFRFGSFVSVSFRVSFRVMSLLVRFVSYRFRSALKRPLSKRV